MSARTMCEMQDSISKILQALQGCLTTETQRHGVSQSGALREKQDSRSKIQKPKANSQQPPGGRPVRSGGAAGVVCGGAGEACGAGGGGGDDGGGAGAGGCGGVRGAA